MTTNAEEEQVTFIQDFESPVFREKKKKVIKNRISQEAQIKESEEMVGPDLTKKPKITYLDIISENLPTSELYERSLMHRENINIILCSNKMNVIVTISVDGHVKFWRKSFRLIDFTKHFRAHTGIITCAAFNQSNDKLITVSPADKTIKIFDVQNQDLLDMIKL
jgi:peptidylprolyl isomerase domain and WD repeat-containing protein 1